jgi:hypothetical protein
MNRELTVESFKSKQNISRTNLKVKKFEVAGLQPFRAATSTTINL